MRGVAFAGHSGTLRIARRRGAQRDPIRQGIAGVLHRRSLEQRLLVEHRQRPREHRGSMRPGVHPDGVLGAGLHTEAANDAAQLIDLEPDRELLDGLDLVLARLDVDALRRAGRRAHVASHAARLSVDARDQPVHAPVSGRIRLALLGVVDGGYHVHARALAVEDLGRGVAEAEQVLEKVVGEHAHPLDGLAQVEPLAEAKVGLRSGARALVVWLVHVSAPPRWWWWNGSPRPRSPERVARRRTRRRPTR